MYPTGHADKNPAHSNTFTPNKPRLAMATTTDTTSAGTAPVPAAQADMADPAAKASTGSTPRRSADTASLPPLQTNTGHRRKPTPQLHPDADGLRTGDFEGEVATDNELPSVEAVRALQDHLVMDKEGKTRTFRSLYNGKNSARRVLVIFIRHFFCGVRVPPPFTRQPAGPLAPPKRHA
ncbi:hypothetical protein IMZ48_08700 [Candidatus Bathyarchaeota archaeon]|nr:hypothetical protein [Candidatus Bathyarchaeota archaeon]